MKFTLKRVIYGKKDTPEHLKEFQMKEHQISPSQSSPVGTKSEWGKWAKENKHEVEFEDNLGKQDGKLRWAKKDDTELGRQEKSKQWIHKEQKWDIKKKIFMHKLKYLKF